MSVPEVAADSASKAADVLLTAARPELYRVNAFRVLGLPADASARDLSKHLEMIEMAEKFGRGRVRLGLLDMQPPPDTYAVRSATQRLRDPELRLVDELFWFWPHELGDGKRDPALAALARGEVKAAGDEWRRQELLQSDASVSAHNLAVLVHAEALDLEFKARSAKLTQEEQERRDQCWEEAVSRWRMLLGKEGFWSRTRARIRELDDPRLTSESAQHLRERLLQTLCSVNASLAVQSAERGDAAEVERHKGVLAKWAGGTGETAQEALRDALKPLRERINTLCRVMEEQADADPAHANQVTRRLIDETRPLLAALDLLLPPGDPRRDGAHDEVALRALTCQIVFGNKTENWVASEALLVETMAIAAGEAARTRVERNLGVVRSNKLLGACYFCEQNRAEDAHSYTVPIHGNVRTETVAMGYNYRQVRTTWQHGEVKVPRCGECAKVHKKYTSARALGPWMGIFFAVVTGLMVAGWEGYFDIGAAMRLPYAIGMFVSFLISVNLGLGVARAWIRGRKPPCALHKFPPLVERTRVWKYGAGPSKSWSGPSGNNPERGKLGNWEPFRRRILARPGMGEMLLVGVPAACCVLLCLSVPILGFIVGVPEATWGFYRFGALSKGAAIERLAAIPEQSMGMDRNAHMKAQMWLAAILQSLGPGDRRMLPLLEKLARSEDPGTRVMAARAVMKIVPETAAPTLLGWLRGPDRMLRPIAAELLAGLGPAGRQAVPELQKAADGRDPELGRAAAAALVKLAPETMLPKLIAGLGSVDPLARKQAAQFLGEAGPAASTAIPALEKAASLAACSSGAACLEAAVASSSDVQEASYVALMKVAPQVYVRKFIPLLRMGTIRIVAMKAAQLLGEAGPAAIQAEPALVAATQSSDEVVSRAAAVALAKIAPESRIPQLIANLEGSGWRVRQSAALTLGELGTAARRAAPALEKAAHDSDRDVRKAAEDALAAVAPELALSAALERLQDTLWTNRQNAAETLGRLGPAAREAVPQLRTAASDRVTEVAWAAEKALAKIAPETGVPRLMARLTDTTAPDRRDAAVPVSGTGLAPSQATARYRREAIVALGEIGRPAGAAVPLLEKALEDASPEVRQASETALARIAPEHSLPRIIARLKSPDWTTRLKAAQDLGAMGPAARAALPELKRAIRDYNASVRQAADGAVAAIAPEQRISVLIERLRSPEWTDRQRAAENLGRFGPAARQAEPALARAMTDSDPDVRRAAAGALTKIRGQ